MNGRSRSIRSDPEGKTDEEVAGEGLNAMENRMKEEIGVVMSIKDLGVTEEMLPGLVQSTLVMEGGYKVLGCV